MSDRHPGPSAAEPDCGCKLSPDERVSSACHALRQPLQTLFLLRALLANSVDSARAKSLVDRFDVALIAMSTIVDDLSPDASSRQSCTRSAAIAVKSAALRAAPVAVVHDQGRADALPRSVIFVVDDDDEVRAAIRSVLEEAEQIVEDYSSCEAFLSRDRRGDNGCLLIDAYLPGMSGLELLRHLQCHDTNLAAIMITGHSDVAMAVEAMKAGAVDFIEKPISRDDLLTCVERALERSRDRGRLNSWQHEAAEHIAGLTSRQREVMDRVLAGHPSKNIAADLGISQRTVENHRASIMRKTGAGSLPALTRLAVAARAVDTRTSSSTST